MILEWYSQDLGFKVVSNEVHKKIYKINPIATTLTMKTQTCREVGFE